MMFAAAARSACTPCRVHAARYLALTRMQRRNLRASATAWGRETRLQGPLRWSYVSRAGSEPLLGLTVGQALHRARELFPDRESVLSVHQDVSKTFHDLYSDSRRLAAGLVAAGLEPGDRLGIWSPNVYEWVVTQFAAAMSGLVLVSINPSYRPSELEFCLKKVEVKAIISALTFKTSNYYEMLQQLVPQLDSCSPMSLKSDRLPHLKTVIMLSDNTLPGTVRYSDVLELGTAEHDRKIEELDKRIQFDSPCNIQFTSGTTGLPKGAVLTHHNIVNNAYFIGLRALCHQKETRICLSVPLFHCFGCVAGTMLGILFGSTCVMPSAGFNPHACIEAILAHRVTSCYGTPTMYVDILAAAREKVKGERLSETLVSGLMGGSPCPAELVTAVINELGMKDVLYGLTETSTAVFQCFPDDSPEIRSRTIGFPSDHTEVKIIDTSGNIVPVGVEGELCVRGYCVFKGYWQDEDKTKEIVSDSKWLKTGDLASLDEYGYGTIRGRKKDVIIRGGENIYPAELENFFLTHPNVIEAQVFGVPDPRMGEEVAVWVRLKDKDHSFPDSFRNWCKGKIAHYKIPRYVLVKDWFPKTISGKVQKFKMREETVQELGL